MKFNKNKDKLLIKKRYQPNICIKFITKIEISELYFKIKIYAQEYGKKLCPVIPISIQDGRRQRT
jgi:hypothetical protein